MNEEDNKIIEDQLKTLPSELRQAVDAMPWKTFVSEIGIENNLVPEQISILEQETMFIIYGFENPNDYVNNLMRELEISEDVATTIAEAVANKIFEPINQKVGQSSQDIHPMVEPGETVHEIPHVEEKAEPAPEPPPLPRPEPPKVEMYQGGQDPYRESIL